MTAASGQKIESSHSTGRVLSAPKRYVRTLRLRDFHHVCQKNDQNGSTVLHIPYPGAPSSTKKQIYDSEEKQ